MIDIRAWKMEDASSVARMLSNKKITDYMRDGYPYPYTEKDAEEFIEMMQNADKDKVFGFAITMDDLSLGRWSISNCWLNNLLNI